MSKYINAELYRIFHKKITYLLLLAAVILPFIVLFVVNSPDKTAGFYLQTVITALNLSVVFVGVLVFSFVYLDDFKSKALVATIATGQSRKKIVLSKQIIIWFLTLLAYIFLTVVLIGECKILGYTFSPEQTNLIFLQVLGNYINVLGFCAIGSIIVYLTQNTAPSIVVVLLLIVGFVKSIGSVALNAMSISGAIYEPIFLSNASANFTSSLIIGEVDVLALLICIAYIFIPTLLSIQIFKTRELNFD
ncbi:ABC-2 family transporter protein [Anaerosphaera aminiphila DSM 21120]|uniref:ABC-2 family transporter protein n=1 Tax=Anaerosphaera aminiphila DSM 21120 TaxID=1120995 RepID=A0A1M5RA19_9FIRM|nr:ABC transporter permease [Anaerosphaera aminiphila]SHH22919.1 ABC-2 family transporter protein [Anaerosphaera aminiphila DSM 21120]